MDSNTLNIKKTSFYCNLKESSFFPEECQLINVGELREFKNYHFATHSLPNESGKDHQGWTSTGTQSITSQLT